MILSVILIVQIAGFVTYGTDSSKRNNPVHSGNAPENNMVRNDPPGKPRTMLLTPATISQHFRTVYQSVEQPVEKPPETVIREISRNPYRFVGIIMDADGVGRIYVKNTDNNRIIKARLDGLPENGIRHFQNDVGKSCIEVDGTTYIIEKDER